MLRGADEYAHRFDEVPVHLVVCVELAALAITDAALDRPSIVGGASIYPFVQNILLGLRHEGLGAAFTTLLVPAEAAGPRAARDPGRDRARRVTSRSATARIRGRRSCAATRSSEFVFGERYGAPW